jgi:hypothetical protein
MDKPFDKEVLKERMKAEGLPLLEDSVERVYKVFSKWMVDSAAIHSNPLVQAVLPPAMEAADKLVLGQVDKIDGVEGQAV